MDTDPSSELRGAPVILGLARLVLVLTAIGGAVAVAFLSLRGESAVGELFFVELGWSEPRTTTLELIFAGTLLFASCILLLPTFAVGRLPGRIAMVVLATGMFAVAAARTVMGGEPFAEWTLLASAVRIAVPLALLFVGFGSVRAGRQAAWILRVAVATTFAAHGVEALSHSPQFVDLILIADGHLSQYLGGRLLFDEPSTRTLLTGIGMVDLGLAFAVLVLRSRVILTYMIFWGLLTAAARLLAGGVEWWPLALERIANGGAPLALVFLMVALRRSRAAKLAPLPAEEPTASDPS